jgi:hypothetical protein
LPEPQVQEQEQEQKAYNHMKNIRIVNAEESAVKYVSETDRKLYEPNWSIPNDNCDIRAKMLEKASIINVTKNKNCTVTYGKWNDPYTGITLEGNPFRGEDGTNNDLDIDHIIPLGYVHEHGGEAWKKEKKKLYGSSVESMNDGLYIAVSSSANKSKSDKGPSKWMPKSIEFQCTYVEDWRNIAAKWEISLDQVDYDFTNDKLEDCGVE